MLRFAIAVCLSGILCNPMLAQEIGFAEEFVLSKDRAKTLQQLIPSSEDYYFYNCLHRLNTEQYDKAAELFTPWEQAFSQTARWNELRLRHAFLTYDRDPKKAYDFIIRHYNLQFNHQKIVAGVSPNLPTKLDPKLISREALRDRAFRMDRLANDIEASAYDWLLINEKFTDHLVRRAFLQRITLPDTPNVVGMIAADLAAPNPNPFGSFAIHTKLTMAQLDELATARPQLKNESAFVNFKLVRMQPGADDNWRNDPVKAAAYFERLETYSDTLSQVYNPLKANVLYQRLLLDRNRGQFDKARFLKYIALPRRQGYMSLRLLETQAVVADLNADYTPLTLLGRVGSDELLVREYLKHFLADADSAKEFEPFINDVYLRKLFAETKIELGKGDAEQWAKVLSPDEYATLKNRIDIDFLPTNKTFYAADEPVQLTLGVKNVPTLIVKIFEINTANYYKQFKREIETDMNLDGLVANAERTVTYNDPPTRRIDRRFDFPELNKPGVYIVDFIGGTKSSRALIRKGKLRPIVRTGSSGQIISVVDDKNQQVKNATIWLSDKEYKPNENGEIRIPFSSSPSMPPIVILANNFACFDYMTHEGETYTLNAGIYVDREQMLSQRLATVAIRPSLMLNGKPVSLSLLEQITLTITAVDRDNITTTSVIPIEKLFEDRETTNEFRVAPRMQSISFLLSGKVKVLTTAQEVSVQAIQNYSLNSIDTTDKIEDLHFAKFGNDYVIEILGKTGEAKGDRPIVVRLKHRDFRQTIDVALKSDDKGRVMLGELKDIVNLNATAPDGQLAHFWQLPTDRCTQRATVHVKAGGPVVLPYAGSSKEATRAEFALFRMINQTIIDDLFAKIDVASGTIVLRDLTPGDYQLHLKLTGEIIRIRVVDGPIVNGYYLGQVRHLEANPLTPVRIESIKDNGDTITIKLGDASKYARLHLMASRYSPEYSAYAQFAKIRGDELNGVSPSGNDSMYITGRDIGDEYRYVLDRKRQKPFTGNMLDRPQLLLNPWALRVTESGEQLAKEGQDFQSKGAPKPSAGIPPVTAATPTDPSGTFNSVAQQAKPNFASNLDFLGDSSVALHNLVPEADGTITIRKAALGSKAWLTIMAVDPLHTIVKTLVLPESKAMMYDLRLANGLDPKSHFMQQKQVSILETGKPFVIDDAVGTRFEAYDSLGKVFDLYQTFVPELEAFRILKTWHTLKDDEKRKQYSELACHEIHFFLFKKDRPFFDAVIKPYLANKKDKTFLDHFLLGDDLKEFVKPWAYHRLNTVEKILLARVLPNESTKTAKYLADQYRLIPVNLAMEQTLYDQAIQSRSLRSMGGIGGGFGGFGGGIGGFPAGDLRNSGKGLDSSIPLSAKPNFGGMPGGGGGAPRGEAKGTGEAGGRRGATSDAPRKAVDELRATGKMKNGVVKELEQAEKKIDEKFFQNALKSDEFYEVDRKKLAEPELLYRKIDPTKEWAEQNYYKTLIQQHVAELITVNPFWVDFAKFEGNGSFLSKHVHHAHDSVHEAIFALAVTNLPFDAPKHETKFDKGQLTFTPGGPVIAFHEEVKPTGLADGKLPILISQNIYKHGDRYREENGEKLDKFVTDEFVVHTVYGMQIVVTNPSPSKQRLSVLVQIPVGAIPLANAKATKTHLLELDPYRTGTIDVLFYFPAPGTMNLYPAHVSRNDQPVASAKPMTLNVVAKATKQDQTSWDYVSQSGTNDDVIAFMNRENVHGLNLDLIAWRLNDAAFFERVLGVIGERHLYQPTVYSYGVKLNHLAASQEFLKHLNPAVGGQLTSPLLTNDPVAEFEYQHLEYKPLVNARAYALGNRRQIVNASVHAQYHALLHQLEYKANLSPADRLAVVYSMLLQDRVDEADGLFAEVKRDAVSTKMQHDLVGAYLALSKDDPAKARALSQPYANYPVDRWKQSFMAVINILDEAEGKGAAVANAEDRTQLQAKAAAKEPAYEFTLDSQQIKLTYQNLSSVEIHYYPMDVELLFSRNPFVQQGGTQSATIKPKSSQTIALDANGTAKAIPLPDEFKSKNVLIEVVAAGKRKSLPWYATTMTVTMVESFGQVKVTNTATGKPLSKVYVKTYVRCQDGTVKFYKDGYTDIRGRFDYATVSTPERSPPVKFAILVLSDEYGATIKDANPPQQ